VNNAHVQAIREDEQRGHMSREHFEWSDAPLVMTRVRARQDVIDAYAAGAQATADLFPSVVSRNKELPNDRYTTTSRC
jgi:hypothetical protein